MSGPLEIKVGQLTLSGAPGGHLLLWDDGNGSGVPVSAESVAQLAEALLAFVVMPAPSHAETKRPQAAECRSCGKLIFWAVTPAGRKMPVDAGPTADGTLVLSLQRGELHVDRWREGEPSHAAPRNRWTSHFASCVHAEQHRRTK
jgi:hypothetical protein